MIIETEIELSEYILEDTITFLKSKDRRGAIEELIEQFDNSNEAWDKKELFDYIMKRESVVSTGIGMGIAIPHARCPNIEDFAISVGISQDGIGWDAIDGLKVKLIFLIVGPEAWQKEYLLLLSQLTKILKEDQMRENLLQIREKSDLVKIFHS